MARLTTFWPIEGAVAIERPRLGFSSAGIEKFVKEPEHWNRRSFAGHQSGVDREFCFGSTSAVVRHQTARARPARRSFCPPKTTFCRTGARRFAATTQSGTRLSAATRADCARCATICQVRNELRVLRAEVNLLFGLGGRFVTGCCIPDLVTATCESINIENRCSYPSGLDRLTICRATIVVGYDLEIPANSPSCAKRQESARS